MQSVEPSRLHDTLTVVAGAISHFLAEGPYLWWARNGALERMDKDGERAPEVVLADVSAFAVADTALYAYDYVSRTLRRYTREGEPVELIAENEHCDYVAARGDAVYCADGFGLRGRQRTAESWRELGRSPVATFQATGLTVSREYIYWLAPELTRVPVGGGAPEVLMPTISNGLTSLGRSVFFSSAGGDQYQLLEYRDATGVTTRGGALAGDIAVTARGIYVVDVAANTLSAFPRSTGLAGASPKEATGTVLAAGGGGSGSDTSVIEAVEAAGSRLYYVLCDASADVHCGVLRLPEP